MAGAKAGTLTFLVGGTEAAFKLACPFLEHMGRRIVHCGGAGSGLAAKICNNLMLGVEQVVTAEAMLLGQRLGVRPEVLADVIGSSTGACWSMSKNNPVPAATPGIAPPSERDFEGGFATALMIKVRKTCLLIWSPINDRKFTMHRIWASQWKVRNGWAFQCRLARQQGGFTKTRLEMYRS